MTGPIREHAASKLAGSLPVEKRRKKQTTQTEKQKSSEKIKTRRKEPRKTGDKTENSTVRSNLRTQSKRKKFSGTKDSYFNVKSESESENEFKGVSDQHDSDSDPDFFLAKECRLLKKRTVIKLQQGSNSERGSSQDVTSEEEEDIRPISKTTKVKYFKMLSAHSKGKPGRPKKSNMELKGKY